jgi:hypothetical protein
MDIVALVSVIGITLSGVLTTLFTSRCKNIDCCWGGIVCERKVKGDNDNDDVVIAREVNREEVASA